MNEKSKLTAQQLLHNFLRDFKIIFNIPNEIYYEISGSIFSYLEFRNQIEKKLFKVLGNNSFYVSEIQEIALPIPRIIDIFYLNYLNEISSYKEIHNKYQTLLDLYEINIKKKSLFLLFKSKNQNDLKKLYSLINYYLEESALDANYKVYNLQNLSLNFRPIVTSYKLAIDKFHYNNLVTQIIIRDFKFIEYNLGPKDETITFNIDDFPKVFAIAYFHHIMKCILFIFSIANNNLSNIKDEYFSLNLLFQNFQRLCLNIGIRPELYLYELLNYSKVDVLNDLFDYILSGHSANLSLYYTYLKNIGLLDNKEIEQIEYKKVINLDETFLEQIKTL
jgi:hypothetical protein